MVELLNQILGEAMWQLLWLEDHATQLLAAHTVCARTPVGNEAPRLPLLTSWWLSTAEPAEEEQAHENSCLLKVHALAEIITTYMLQNSLRHKRVKILRAMTSLNTSSQMPYPDDPKLIFALINKKWM